ncbi:S1C family serine protease [Sulfobacillus harzensis]|uniref:S1C family serine protease n=1 Tax=Sulfobacillus harzensis TaxID=2729629 RepID=UPI0030846E72
MGLRIKTLIVGIAGLLLGAWLMTFLGPKPNSDTFNWPAVEVAKRVGPSVVVVQNNRLNGSREQMKGMGSGVVLNREGDIVTNYHVVQGADALTVVLSTGQRFRARVVGVDPPTDLAVIRIHAQHLVPIHFTSSRAIEPGQLVVAIGNSLGLTHTVTVGVVSAKDRVMYRDGWEYHLIQTDAAINPGNSGGPLVNDRGELIGINSSKIAQTGVEGIGFAIPSDTVQYVVQQLIRYGRVRRPWMGITLQPVPNHQLGMMIVSVAPNGPAAVAGLRAGDLVTAINHHPVHNLRDVVKVLEHTTVGREIDVSVLRGTANLTVRIRLQEIPQPAASEESSTAHRKHPA